MDQELALYMQPWFEDPTLETSEQVSFWFRRMGIDQKEPLMVGFVHGTTLKVRLHLPPSIGDVCPVSNVGRGVIAAKCTIRLVNVTKICN